MSNDEKDCPTPTAPGLPFVAPDYAEDQHGDLIDNIVPSYGYSETPMVGLGGSAGALEALTKFFGAMPPDSGIVFVVIVHLSPEHVSLMPELIGRHTQMPTMHAVDGQRTAANHVYVIPPGKHLTAIDGHLRLTDLDHERGRRTAVDLFFRSLADTHGPHAAAIVLSGADGDGMVGIKRIKERGGLTIAQDPSEAEIDSMPRMAMSTGMVDWILPVAAMPARILEYNNRERQLKLPPEEDPQSPPEADRTQAELSFREVLLFLRTRTGRDFSYYKRATILRRISRRIQINSLEDMAGYLAFIRLHQGECGALLQELLISVTNFFRDREAFTALESLIPQLFKGKRVGDTVRVWCPACATGEEAYSVAMLLLEHARHLESAPAIQVFGCDLDEAAIQLARSGVFPDGITADVSEDRLRRFFVKEVHGYRIRQEVRETVLFATHDLLKDAPFSRMDLISCRNLMIYLNRDAQARALSTFHFALNPEALLFLGSSESVEEGNGQFLVLDKKHRLYRRLMPTRQGNIPLPIGTCSLLRETGRPISLARSTERGSPPPAVLPTAYVSQLAAAQGRGSRDQLARQGDLESWSNIHFQLLEVVGPPSIIVDTDHEIRHISASAARFLQVSSGTPSSNLLRLVRTELRVALRHLLFQVAQTRATAEATQLPLTVDGQQTRVALTVSMAGEVVPGLMLVSFRLQSDDESVLENASPRQHTDAVVQHLERELNQLKGHLRDTIEQYEGSTEELKASNEELQAMNEELRSATEELETSREELQSINEELTTVNLEAKVKVEELGHANSDLQNLMSATDIATVFLDRQLRVMRFSKTAAPIFNLIASDIGRPLTDLQRKIRYESLDADAEQTLRTLAPIERELRGGGDTCYLARMLPYRTVEDRIAGVVLTFVDITERQRASAALLAQNEQLERFNEVTIGRELRMVELKWEINTLLEGQGQAPRYTLDNPADDAP